jgi:hypothetical protein
MLLMFLCGWFWQEYLSRQGDLGQRSKPLVLKIKVELENCHFKNEFVIYLLYVCGLNKITYFTC